MQRRPNTIYRIGCPLLRTANTDIYRDVLTTIPPLRGKPKGTPKDEIHIAMLQWRQRPPRYVAVERSWSIAEAMSWEMRAFAFRVDVLRTVKSKKRGPKG